MPPRNKARTAESATKRPSRPTIRERQRAMTRQALLDGAAEAFAEHGYNDVTIDDIASRAGTSRGTFYLYFSKGKVLAELIENAFMAAIGSSSDSGLFADLHEAAPYTVDSVAAWLRGYVAVWHEQKPLVRAWMEGDATDPEIERMTRGRVRRAVSVLTAVLAEQAQQSGSHVDEALLRARATLMDLQLQYFCFIVVVRGLEVDLDLGLRALAEQWCSAIHYED
jgi:AcrR family transcriptional regulator